ncbi:MAG: alkaline phosphatase, partial [Bacteroidales bacterium]|nr:alkaline phosphatase [Bacteroidales bacterium]
IVVTADHETGFLTLGPRSPEDLARLSNQKHSMNVISGMIKEKMEQRQDVLSWEETKDFLSEQLGLWTKINLTWDEEKELRDIYEGTVAKRKAGSVKDLYADNAKIVAAAIGVLNRKCRVYWVSGHSSGYVPVFAIGAGSELFTHKTDNAEIGRLIMQAAAYK